MYKNIGRLYSRMGDFLRAAQFYEKALTYQRPSFSFVSTDLMTIYHDRGEVLENTDKYLTIYSCVEPAVEKQNNGTYQINEICENENS